MLINYQKANIYQDEKLVLENVDFQVNEGEFIYLIGRVGSGKSSLLKTIYCELDIDPEDAERADVLGESVLALRRSRVPALRKQMGIIFQDFQLLHDRTVYRNLRFVLKATGWTDNEKIDRRIIEVLAEVGMSDKAEKMPSELSGGEQQRIAIARAIVNEPKVLLLDEPLGALDLKLRQSMQYELIRLKEELGITFVYVTHDQEEALTMSDTIVVMNQGYIQQIGTPENIYNEPENAFVADFIGHSNIIDGTMIKDELVEILGARWACVDKGFGNNKPVDVVIRPEDVELVDPSEGTLQGEVTSLIFKGVHYELDVMAGGYEWLVHTTRFVPVGTKVGIKVIPFNIQIMHKPESSDEKAVEIDA